MFTKLFHQCGAGGLFALAVVASPLSSARADWTITGSCVGGWGMRNCVVNQRDFPRNPHVRHVHGNGVHGSGQHQDSSEVIERERQESLARDRKWLAFCKPVMVVDRFGVNRYAYAKPGCEFGRAE